MACANRVPAGRRFFLPARLQLFRIASRRLIAADHHPWEMAALTARQSVRFKPRATLQTQTWNRKASLNGGLTFPRACGNWPRTAFSMGAWQEILQHVERRVNPHSFATWFRPTRQEDTESDRLVIRVPTRLFRKRLTEPYGELLQAVLLEVGLANTRLEFVCSEPEPPPSAGSGAAATATKQARLDFDAVDYQLNPRYTFETFVVGASNQFAHAASLAVAESPSKGLQPAVPIRRRGHGKDPPDAGRGPRHQEAHPGDAAHLHQRREVHHGGDQLAALRPHDHLPRSLPYRGCSAGGRHPVHRRQGAHPGGVLPHLQRALRPAEADHYLFRLPAQGDLRDRRAPALPLRVGADRRHPATRLGNQNRHPAEESRNRARAAPRRGG